MVATAKKGSDVATKLHNRAPEPVRFVMNGQSGASAVFVVNSVEGYAADITVQIRRSSLAATFELRDNNGNVLDDVDVLANGNGVLKTILQQSEKAIPLGVSPSVAAGYDMTVTILRHRITGVV